MIDRRFIGNSAAFIAAVLFGAAIVATRMVVGSIPPLSLAFLRFSVELSAFSYEPFGPELTAEGLKAELLCLEGSL